jgi:flotillin
VLTDISNTLFTGDPEAFTNQIKTFAGRFGITSEDLKNLTVSALLARMTSMADDKDTLSALGRLSDAAKHLDLGGRKADMKSKKAVSRGGAVSAEDIWKWMRLPVPL